ncbi:MAG TPA: SpoIIE family protein phosphatase [Acidimicrobiales bacterium]|nr:SpoIIE family protein phosphatase [Acidimicrobiales bacterium]
MSIAMAADLTDPAGRNIRQVLEESGPVGRDLLAVDWATTSLGPPEGWPASLKTMVSVVLRSRFSMWMAWGPELTFFCNDAYRRDTLGVKYPWALGRPADQVWAEIWPDIGPRIERVLDTGEATWDEALLLFLERSGFPEETYHTFSYSPLTGDTGAITGMLCVVSEETDRVIAQRRMAILRDLGATSATDMSEVQVCAAASTVLAAEGQAVPFCTVYLFDGDGTAGLAATGGLPSGHEAAPASIAPDDPDPVWPVREVLAGRTEKVELGVRFAELPRGQWPDPPLHALVTPLLSQSGSEPYGFLVAGLNRYRPLDDAYRSFVTLVADQITTQVAKARSFDAERRRAEDLAELDRAKTAFFTGVSHELRTPLTLILGPTDDVLAGERGAINDAQRDALEMVRGNAARLQKLVNSLLDFSRLESGQTWGHFEPVDLAGYTAELSAMFRSAFERSGLLLDVQLPPLSEPVYVDRDHWSKIVLNLLSNALKFTFEGSVAVRLVADDGEVELSVADTGGGIPVDQQLRLFERFHRVEGARARTHEGSGIGLALVAELARLHGGDVSVESISGTGSTFRVRIPLGAGHLPADQVAAAASESESSAAERARGYLSEAIRWLQPETGDDQTERAGSDDDRPHVLVVDDNADLRNYMTRLLAEDYQVTTAADGIDALTKARRDRPDLILTDVMMPRLDGFGLLRQLRADTALAATPVIMVSARAGEEGTVEGLEAGADDYLIKPFGARELIARVAANLELERNRRARADLEEAQRLAGVGSWELDLSAWTLRGSPEYFRLLDADPAAVRQHGVYAAFARVHTEDVERARRAMDAAERGDSLDVEFRLVMDGGEVRHLRALGVFRTGASGHAGYIHGSLQDVTAQRQAEAAQAAVAVATEAAAREQAIADQLQASLLPPVTPNPEGLEVATFYRAGVEGTQVGGDWYDIIELGSGRTALVLGDVMGRGVAAAALMGQLRSAVRAYARLDLPPAELLGLCDQIVADLGEDQLVTVIYAVYDPAIHKISYANAGHLPPLVALPDGTVRRGPRAGRPPLGAGGPPPPEQELPLPPGSTLALYTDGLVERRGQDIEPAIDVLQESLGQGGPAEEVLERILAALVSGPPDDDVALLVAHSPVGSSGSTLLVAVPPEPSVVGDVRHRIAAALAEWGVDPKQSESIVLVACELVTNAIVHGRPPIEFRARRTSDRVVLEVQDHARLLPHLRSPSADDEHGRGLQLVRALSKQWGIRPTGTGKWVWCNIALEDGPPG